MPSIQTLIGKRFESILQKKYPALEYIGDDNNLVPDFEHPLFYAEAKVSFIQPDYASHLKQYQIENFKKFEKKKPVIYIIGFHNFGGSIGRLNGLSLRKRGKIISEEMEIIRFYIVNNKVISNIWEKRNSVCEKGHIMDCTLREGHLRQIIKNSQIMVAGKKYSARSYYNIPSNNFSFSLPSSKNDGEIEIGHIMPSEFFNIIHYFHK